MGSSSSRLVGNFLDLAPIHFMEVAGEVARSDAAVACRDHLGDLTLTCNPQSPLDDWDRILSLIDSEKSDHKWLVPARRCVLLPALGFGAQKV